MTQIERVVDYINKFGSITPLDAFRDLGITKLATVLSDARLKCGMTVFSSMEKSYNRFGEKTNYKRYFLDEKEYNAYLKLEKEPFDEDLYKEMFYNDK